VKPVKKAAYTPRLPKKKEKPGHFHNNSGGNNCLQASGCRILLKTTARVYRTSYKRACEEKSRRLIERRVLARNASETNKWMTPDLMESQG
jgi:hypothetical protein